MCLLIGNLFQVRITLRNTTDKIDVTNFRFRKYLSRYVLPSISAASLHKELKTHLEEVGGFQFRHFDRFGDLKSGLPLGNVGEQQAVEEVNLRAETKSWTHIHARR